MSIQRLPSSLVVPPAERQDCINEAQFRWENKIATIIRKLQRDVSIVVNAQGDPDVFGIGVELREKESGPVRDVAARDLDVDAGVIVPGVGILPDGAVIVFASPMADANYNVEVDNWAAYGVVTAGPISPINIKRHWTLGVLAAATFAINFHWTVTDNATADNAPLLALPVPTEFDNYAALVAAHAPLGAYAALIGSGLENFTYRIGDF